MENETNYKNPKRLFKSTKRKSKKLFYSEQLIQFHGDTKKPWLIIKEVIGKARKTQSLLPHKTIVNNLEMNEEIEIANKFNNFFIEIGSD